MGGTRAKLLCFLLLDTIPSISPKIASGNARNHPPERFPSRQHSNTPRIFSIKASPSSTVFRQPFITLVTRICFGSPREEGARGALTRETRAEKRVAAAPFPPPSGFIPGRQDTANNGNFGNRVGFHREFKLAQR